MILLSGWGLFLVKVTRSEWGHKPKSINWRIPFATRLVWIVDKTQFEICCEATSDATALTWSEETTFSSGYERCCCAPHASYIVAKREIRGMPIPQVFIRCKCQPRQVFQSLIFFSGFDHSQARCSNEISRDLGYLRSKRVGRHSHTWAASGIQHYPQQGLSPWPFGLI